MWQQGLHQEISTGYSKLTVSTTPGYPPFLGTAAVFKHMWPNSFIEIAYWASGFRPPGVVQLCWLEVREQSRHGEGNGVITKC